MLLDLFFDAENKELLRRLSGFKVNNPIGSTFSLIVLTLSDVLCDYIVI